MTLIKENILSNSGSLSFKTLGNNHLEGSLLLYYWIITWQCQPIVAQKL